MTEFWPNGLKLDDTESPLQILQSARVNWEKRSGGQLTLFLQDTETTEDDPMIIVHAQHVESKRTVTLFSVIHRVDAPYPARIQPRDNELPDFLRKTYYKPGIGDVSMNLMVKGRTVENKWVCDTPSEFRQRLKDAFNSGVLKSEILSLVSSNSSSTSEEKDSETEPETETE